MPFCGSSVKFCHRFHGSAQILSVKICAICGKISMMNVSVNNQLRSVQKDANLLNVLEQNGVQGQKGIAVAVNNAVIPKAEWKNRILLENDRITVIKASQGG